MVKHSNFKKKKPKNEKIDCAGTYILLGDLLKFEMIHKCKVFHSWAFFYGKVKYNIAHLLLAIILGQILSSCRL